MVRRLPQANRRNCLHSTGPKSPAGKLSASRNAIKHGLSGKPELSDRERSRFDSVRNAISEMVDDDESYEQDIRECAISQVLLERTITLRYRSHAEDTPVTHELEKLIRFENRLTKRRDKLLERLDIDEYADVEPEVWRPST